ncbi:hypothetical protein ABBQ32_012079 [Trebouxia sp. C0010 RCD-2024]
MGTNVGRARGIFAVLVLISLATPVAAGPLMAVDFGSDFIKVAVTKPGRLPEIVTNEMTKRRTSAQVAFVDGNRLLGEEAAALSIRYPTKVYSRLRDLLGKPAQDPSIKALKEQNLLPFSIEAEPQRGTVTLKIDDGSDISSEQLVGSMLHYAKGITEAFAGAGQVLDCVITVPAFFGQSQRQAITEAARLAGLTVLSLVNNHAAAALQHGITRNFVNKTEHVIFYDMGASSVEAALIKYSSFDVKEFGKVNSHSQFEVKDVAWDANTGAQYLDMLLVNHFADQFESKHAGSDVRSNPRAVAKLKRQARRTKEMLSANTEAPFIVEELLDGQDFRSSIKRQQLEELAGDFFQRAAKPLQKLLQRNGLAPTDVHAVELLGGGSRIPKLQAELGLVLKGRLLDKHLDADEAIVRGGAFYAANLSTTFRLAKKFGMADGTVYPITFQLDESTKVKTGEAGSAFKPKTLLSYMKKFPTKRVVHLPNVTADPIKFALLYNVSQSRGLPPGTASPVMAQFVVTGVDSTLTKYNTTGKMGVHFSVDSSSILKVDKAESVIEVWEEYEVEVPVEPPAVADTAKENGTTKARETLEDDDADEREAAAEAEEEDTGRVTGKEGGANETAAKAKPAVVTTKETRSRKKTFRVALTIAGPGFAQPAMSPDQLKAGKQRMQQLQQAEQSRAAAAQAKNDLEAYIISTQARLADDEEVQAVTTNKQRIAFQADLSKVEDWLYDQGEHEQAPVFREKLSQLRNTGDGVFFRVSELRARPEALRLARQFVQLASQTATAWPTSKPWINATDSENLTAELQAFTQWLDEEERKQEGVAAHEEPVLQSSTISARLLQLRNAFEKLNKKKKPAPPPAPKQQADTTDETVKADGEQSEAQAETDSTSQDSKASSTARSKGTKDSSNQGEKAKHSEKMSDKSMKNNKGKGKGKKRDMDDLRSKLPPDLQGKIFDMKDMDLDSLKAKLDAMKLDKQGTAESGDHDEL